MVLIFRCILTLLLVGFRRRIDPLGESVLHFTVLPTDLDLNIHMNAGRYLSFMDLGRVELIARTGVLRKALRRGWRPINAGSLLYFRRSLMPFERFRVRSRILCWDERWFFFEHTIERADGTLAATAHTRALMRGREGNIAPAQLVALAGKDVPSPPMPELVARWIHAEAAR